jgi:hypothetical protein
MKMTGLQIAVLVVGAALLSFAAVAVAGMMHGGPV